MKKYVKSTIVLGILIFLAALVGQSTAHGYIHPADPLVLMAGMLLPTPYAMICAGTASLLADLAKGYYLLAPVTLIIKLVMILAIKALLKTAPAKKFPEVMVSLAALIPIPGYYFAELLFQLCTGSGILGSFSIAAVTLRKDSIQAVASILLFIIIYDLYKGIKAGRDTIRRMKEQQNEEETQQ